MNLANKLKPIAALFSFEADNGVEIASYKTELHALHVHDGQVTAAGALVGKDGSAVATVNLQGIPVSEWSQPNPVGRPKSSQKHLAIFLAWCLEANRQNCKYGLADEHVARAFNFSAPEKIRNIRQKQAKLLGISIEKNSENLIHVHDPSGANGCDAVICITKPTWWQESNGGFVVCGPGYAWKEGFNDSVSHGIVRCDVPNPGEGFCFEDQSRIKGPVIISIFKPALK